MTVHDNCATLSPALFYHWLYAGLTLSIFGFPRTPNPPNRGWTSPTRGHKSPHGVSKACQRVKKQLNYFGPFFKESFLLFTSYSNRPHIAVTGGPERGSPSQEKEVWWIDGWRNWCQPCSDKERQLKQTVPSLPVICMCAQQWVCVCVFARVCMCHAALAGVARPSAWSEWVVCACVHVCVWRKTGRDKRVIECWRRPGASEWTAATSWKIPVCTRSHAHGQGQIHTQGTGGPVLLA